LEAGIILLNVGDKVKFLAPYFEGDKQQVLDVIIVDKQKFENDIEAHYRFKYCSDDSFCFVWFPESMFVVNAA